MTKIEENIREMLQDYLKLQGEMDDITPETPDIEDLWQKIGEAYLPDGIREYNAYPIVSLGWMMYTGMAIAQFWHKDWQKYSTMDNIYETMRDKRGFDLMDEHIREDILGLQGEAFASTERLVQECALRTQNILQHSDCEPGTKDAFMAYISAIHQMYLMGAAIQFHRMGYVMEKA